METVYRRIAVKLGASDFLGATLRAQYLPTGSSRLASVCRVAGFAVRPRPCLEESPSRIDIRNFGARARQPGLKGTVFRKENSLLIRHALFSVMESSSTSPTRLLIVTAEEKTRASLLDHFQASSCQTTTVGEADTALQYLSGSPGYDVVLVEVGLPNKTGFDLLEAARGLPNDIAVVLLAKQSCLEEKLHGYDLGADDYVVRPFAMEELEARIRAVLRRHPDSGSSSPDEDTYTLEDLTIKFSAKTCFRNDRRVPLTSLEFQILEYLIEHQGEVVSRGELRDTIWDDRDGICLRTIDRHVAKIREKLERDPTLPALLQTVYGKGYRFACAEYA